MKDWNFIKKRLQRSCFPANIMNFYEELLWRASANGYFWNGGTDFLCRGISPFSSVDLFIRVLLLGYRLFCREKSDANPPLFTSNIFTSTWFSSAQNSFITKFRKVSTRFAELIRFWQDPKCRRNRTFWRKVFIVSLEIDFIFGFHKYFSASFASYFLVSDA